MAQSPQSPRRHGDASSIAMRITRVIERDAGRRHQVRAGVLRLDDVQKPLRRHAH
jgi:hypothetical protein